MRKEQINLNTKEGLEIYRHSTSHIMAMAVKQLFPEAKLAIGPAIANGFYYDFDLPRTLTPDDLDRISQKMDEIIALNIPFVQEEISQQEAIQLFTKKGETYKLELLNEIPDKTVTIYRNSDFVDLCRGPHVPGTGSIKAFKLLDIAGAYWRGSEKNKMLQRIYGTAFANNKDLKRHLANIAEAKKRDHRKLGRELDLFSTHEMAGAGLIYWHPRGACIRNVIEDFWKQEHVKRGYDLLYTPHIAKINLWQKSGHWDFYREYMYAPMEVDTDQYIIKPMNCPAHILIYKTSSRSYRELPLRWAELGTVYRYEKSGVLHGLLRVRGFTQDDAHIFCAPEQLKDEIIKVLELVHFMMSTFGFDYQVFLSTRPDNKYVGSIENWDKATWALKEALKAMKIDYTVDPGAGVFYGPKIDIKMVDALNRKWQGPTIQVDFNLPDRFDINYIGPDGKEHRAVMIHRAVLGSLERFMGVLIEHYGGNFPLWLAPVQVIILTITSQQEEYARQLKEKLAAAGLRTQINTTPEKINAKIRDAELAKIPYMAIVGNKETQQGTVSFRRHKIGDQGSCQINEFIEKLTNEVVKRK